MSHLQFAREWYVLLSKTLSREVQPLVALAKVVLHEMILQNGTFDLSISTNKTVITVAADCRDFGVSGHWVNGVLNARNEAT